jgi:hypothetical protein
MKRIVLLMVLFLFVTECGVVEGLGYSPLKVEDREMKGDFLFNKGARIVFAPFCFYKRDELRVQCGLSALGVETYFTRSFDLDGQRIVVRYTYSDTLAGEYDEKLGLRVNTLEKVKFDKLMVVTKEDSLKNILQYMNSLRCSKFAGEELNGFNVDSSMKVNYDIIESNSAGIVDFTLKDAGGTRVHIKYDMSHFIQGIRDSLHVSENGIEFLYRQEKFQWQEMKDLETCFTNPRSNSVMQESSVGGDKQTNFLSNSSIDQCISFCNNDSIYHATSDETWDGSYFYYNSQSYAIHWSMGVCSWGDLRVGLLPSDERDSIIECESSIDIEDTSEIDFASISSSDYSEERMSLWKLYKSFCKGVVIFPPQMADCEDEKSNFYYRYKEENNR